MLPLYKDHNFKKNQPSANMGLLFERFFDGYPEDCTKIDQLDKKEGKGEWLEQFNEPVGDTTEHKAYLTRLRDLVERRGGRFQVFSTQYHFVTGMGDPHPVENGFCWHPVLGIPYLPGSAVKGLVRAWMELNGCDAEVMKKWFGSIAKDPGIHNNDTQAGAIIFFDAIPAGEVTLSIDIMTPHGGKWYAQGDQITCVQDEPEKIPADWHDPVPIPFLVVEKAAFFFSVAPRDPSQDIDMTEVLTMVEEALHWLGAGAKTAGGYGQMEPADTHPFIQQQRNLTEQVHAVVSSWTEDQCSENIGKKYSKIMNNPDQGEAWFTLAMENLLENRMEMIEGWQSAPKKSNKRKAYNKLIAFRDQKS